MSIENLIRRVVKVASADATASTDAGELFVGIDPGSTGAVGFVFGRDARAVQIPTYKRKVGKYKRTEFDLDEIEKGFWYLKQTTALRIKVVLEQPVPSLAGGSWVAFRQGIGFGMWPLFLTALGLDFVIVSPQRWKKAMKVSHDKDKSRKLAMKLFPNLDCNLKKDHDRAEAVLMAAWLRSSNA